jgi:hypothetical protein
LSEENQPMLAMCKCSCWDAEEAARSELSLWSALFGGAVVNGEGVLGAVLDSSADDGKSELDAEGLLAVIVKCNEFELMLGALEL